MCRYLVILLLTLFSLNLRAGQPVEPVIIELEQYVMMDLENGIDFTSDSTFRENPRWVAAMLTVGLGFFGMHRLYLGTDVKVPIIYVATLGGGFGVLPFVDLMHILFTKDLEPYKNNTHVFMWIPEKSGDPDSAKA
ncbi:MAG: TM2 domain-containing protein [Flavobacteriales bacterium]|nr:TM2 domain-containing protein [Flavobacteriales bacterium]